MLTDIVIRRLKPGDVATKHTDERGMQLLMTPAGNKLWRLQYRFGGKQKLLTLGAYPDVSLADARQRRDDARKQVANGVDPGAARKAARLAQRIAMENSFESVAKAWHGNWKNDKTDRHASQVLRRLEADVFPTIGMRPVSDIKARDLILMAQDIQKRGALDVGRRALETCGQILRFSVAHGLAERNPAADIRPSDVLKARRKENFARVDAKELPELLRHIDAYQGTPATRIAIKLLANTFVRTSELILARWSEFDLDAKRWDIPADRMKMRTPHIVPLSAQTVTLLHTLHLVSGRREFLFPGERNPRGPMSNNTILVALKRMGYAGRMTGHGFRGVASTILHEQGYAHQHIELQLAHAPRDAVSASYNHALYLQQRTAMMQDWSDYLERAIRGHRDALPTMNRPGF